MWLHPNLFLDLIFPFQNDLRVSSTIHCFLLNLFSIGFDLQNTVLNIGTTYYSNHNFRILLRRFCVCMPHTDKGNDKFKKTLAGWAKYWRK